MLWSQQVEVEEEARLHYSNLMPNKMMTLYYDPSDPSIQSRLPNTQLFQVAFPTIGRTFKTKWWDALKNDAFLEAVKQYFLKHPTQVSTSDDMSQFLFKKQQLQAMLAAAKTPQEFQKILDERSSSFSQENSYAESDDSTSYLPDNGDDCEGILPSIRKSKSCLVFSSSIFLKISRTSSWSLLMTFIVLGRQLQLPLTHSSWLLEVWLETSPLLSS
ncbi:hypothetical protein AAG906_008519 [Vitis piasezkii]